MSLTRRSLLASTAMALCCGATSTKTLSFMIKAHGGGPGGGYNNLTNWPSAGKNSDSANRPQLSGSTLSWIGPLYGGASTANDVAQTLSLTNSSATTTTSNGGTPTFTASSASIAMTNTFSAGNKVIFGVTGGTLDSALTAGLGYFVISTGLSGTHLEVSATSGGSAIVMNGDGTGTVTLGQLIEGLNIGNSFSIAHTHVTFRRNALTCSSGDYAALAVTNTSGPTVIEDNLISGYSPSSHGNAGSYQGISGNLSGSGTINYTTIQRNTLQNFSNHISAGMQNLSVLDNYFWDFCDGDDDYVEINGPCDTVLVQHNTFDAQKGPDYNSAPLDSSSNPNDYFGNSTNITINNNITLNGDASGAQHLFLWDGSQNAGNHITGSFTNNGFYKSSNYGAINNTYSNVTLSANSGNYIAATLTATSGSLINGTGVL